MSTNKRKTDKKEENVVHHILYSANVGKALMLTEVIPELKNRPISPAPPLVFTEVVPELKNKPR